MTFYLGTHKPIWLERLTVPLFVSRRQLFERKTLPRASCEWALDSGGFTEIEKLGTWTVEPAAYAAEVRRYQEEIGRLAWASIQDWMCEPAMLAKTGLTVAEHQRRTTENFLRLLDLAPDLPWVPTLQGWEQDDYLRHWEQYEQAGIELAQRERVGLGSVCRRQHMRQATGIVAALQPLKLHGYGFKMTGISLIGQLLLSSDSLAWSYNARRRPPLPGCPHRSCANCVRWALLWREKVQARVNLLEMRLPL